jgi:acyl carrier protein
MQKANPRGVSAAGRRFGEMAMDRRAVFDKLAVLFEDVMDREGGALSERTTGADVEEWDSLSNVRLIVSAERAFGVRFTNAEIGEFQSLGDIVSAIMAKKAA